uniref:Uncharacterized protein n=1 Tax=Chromera velia CCMP2878 TaxID=1169474 RepID=A0A0G4I1H4_9ALVE|eukprot:Cvel_10162.t1-p1 / transcript=Cvel_10162.t1 / gene=Cvel_10162 / organism=Chromera_velia_CCMP2878 / gene_product=hypothetical protein / transcript_product=hypothetical protein / location=Cvel_scaffold606:49044-49985(+) / protein_length=314 / sequence_SO=supercontig / SO=protein_coding / is_pseudo=false
MPALSRSTPSGGSASSAQSSQIARPSLATEDTFVGADEPVGGEGALIGSVVTSVADTGGTTGCPPTNDPRVPVDFSSGDVASATDQALLQGSLVPTHHDAVSSERSVQGDGEKSEQGDGPRVSQDLTLSASSVPRSAAEIPSTTNLPPELALTVRLLYNHMEEIRINKRRELARMKKEKKETQDAKETVEREKEKLQQDLREIGAVMRKLKEEKSAVDRELLRMKEEKAKAEKKAAEQISELAVVTEQKRQAEEEKRALSVELDNLRASYGRLKNEKEKAESENKMFESQVEKLREKTRNKQWSFPTFSDRKGC